MVEVNCITLYRAGRCQLGQHDVIGTRRVCGQNAGARGASVYLQHHILQYHSETTQPQVLCTFGSGACRGQGTKKTPTSRTQTEDLKPNAGARPLRGRAVGVDLFHPVSVEWLSFAGGSDRRFAGGFGY